MNLKEILEPLNNIAYGKCNYIKLRNDLRRFLKSPDLEALIERVYTQGDINRQRINHDRWERITAEQLWQQNKSKFIGE